jgi:hypothetical protein
MDFVFTTTLQMTSDEIFALFVLCSESWPNRSVNHLFFYSFSMCGHIVIDKIPRGFDISTKDRKVQLLTMKDATLGTLKADETGKFCTYVRPGSYKLKVSLGPAPKSFIITEISLFCKKTGKIRSKLLPSKRLPFRLCSPCLQQPGMIPANAIYLYLVSRSLHRLCAWNCSR